MKKILFDTDIGTDIDDAVCLAYLLKQPECQLLGITTVAGEAEKRAMLASVLCKVAKKNIPIYPGIEMPLTGRQKHSGAPQARALENWEHDTKFENGKAIEFMRETIRNNPGEVTLLAVGPFTNIATLFKTDPEIPGLLKELVVMGGVFTEEFMKRRDMRPEWNATCDPLATEIVYNTMIKSHKTVGLDVTAQTAMDKNEVLRKFNSEILKPVVDFAGVWFEKYDKICFNDPLAAAVIFDEKICGFDKGNVKVEVENQALEGTTCWEPEENGKFDVALKLDKERFFKHYFDIVGEEKQ